MPFSETSSIAFTQQFEQQDKKQFWLDLAQKCIYPALALGVVFMFWRSFKRTKADDIAIGVPVGNGNGNGHLLKPGASGPVTVEVLNQLIRENPANMTQAVRSWMTRGAKTNN